MKNSITVLMRKPNYLFEPVEIVIPEYIKSFSEVADDLMVVHVDDEYSTEMNVRLFGEDWAGTIMLVGLNAETQELVDVPDKYDYLIGL